MSSHRSTFCEPSDRCLSGFAVTSPGRLGLSSQSSSTRRIQRLSRAYDSLPGRSSNPDRTQMCRWKDSCPALAEITASRRPRRTYLVTCSSGHHTTPQIGSAGFPFREQVIRLERPRFWFPCTALAVTHERAAREPPDSLPRGGVFRYRCQVRHASRVAPSGARSLAAWTMTRLHRFAILATMLALSYVGIDSGVGRAAGRSADRGKSERPPARAFSHPAVTGALCSSKLQQGGAAPVAQAARLGHERGPRAHREARLWAT